MDEIAQERNNFALEKHLYMQDPCLPAFPLQQFQTKGRNLTISDLRRINGDFYVNFRRLQVLLTVKDITQALGAQEFFQTGHFILKFTHQFSIGIFIDNSVTFDLFSSVGVSVTRKATGNYRTIRNYTDNKSNCARFTQKEQRGRFMNNDCGKLDEKRH